MIEAFLRHPPTEQPSYASIATRLAKNEFHGQTALIIGGSRGLGEVAAKLAAAGGAHVIATYAAGKADALRVADEIRDGGGTCDILAYDVLQPAESQLFHLPALPDSLYYFATGPILKRNGAFDEELFKKYLSFYVTGFANISAALHNKHNRLSVFYPSSVFIANQQAGLSEYIRAKAEGERLCADFPRLYPGSLACRRNACHVCRPIKLRAPVILKATLSKPCCLPYGTFRAPFRTENRQRMSGSKSRQYRQNPLLLRRSGPESWHRRRQSPAPALCVCFSA